MTDAEQKQQFLLVLDQYGIALYRIARETDGTYFGHEFFAKIGFSKQERHIRKNAPFAQAQIVIENETEARNRFDAARAHANHLDETLIKPLVEARRAATVRWSVEVSEILKTGKLCEAAQ